MGAAMAAIAIGGTMFSAVMSGMAASDQAEAQRAQQEQQEFQRKARQLARDDAARWQMNKNIATAANKNRAEEEFWLRYNFNNETNSFSRNVKQSNDALISNLNARNIKGATAQALKAQRMSWQTEGLGLGTKCGEPRDGSSRP